MPNGAVIEGRSAGQRAKHKSWRAACAATARDVANHDHVPAPLDGPLGLSVEFRSPCPPRGRKPFGPLPARRRCPHPISTSCPFAR